MKISKGKLLLILGIVFVVIDQVIKVIVKTHMTLGEHFDVFGTWFQILFVENEGMAFGMKFGGLIGKFLLTSFRLIFSIALIWWITRLVKHGIKNKDGQYHPVSTGFLVCLVMITAGALGNLIDCLFYGMMFSESTQLIVSHFGGTYSHFMFGKVVDMFYFPLIDTTLPSWLPWIGGSEFRFFEPVFNFADSLVSVGAVLILIFYRKYLM